MSQENYEDTVLQLKAMFMRNRYSSDYKDLVEYFDSLRPVLNKELGLTFEFHSRLKSLESIMDKLRNDENTQLIDIIGLRLTNPWTKNIHLIADYLKTKLKIDSTVITERNRVIYLFGKTEKGNVYEIQLWTSLIYHCFEFEHDRVYKPKVCETNELGLELKEKSNHLRDEQHKIQDIIDANVLVPY